MLGNGKRIHPDLFRWSIEPISEEKLKELEKGQGNHVAIVTQAWSLRGDMAPGRGNFELSDAMFRLAQRLPFAALLPQVEVSLPREDREYAKVIGILGNGKSTPEWNTLTVAKAQVEFCRECWIQTVIVVAHPVHMARSIWCYRMLGIPKVYAAPVETNWSAYEDPELVHWSMRHPLLRPALTAREYAAKALFLKMALQGKIKDIYHTPE